MRKFFWFSIGFWLGALCVSISSHAYQLIKLQEVDLVFRKFVPGRSALLYPEAPKEALGVSLAIDIADWFYWNPAVYAMTTDAQYRSVGLEFNLGIHLTKWLDVSYFHHSEHLLERTHSFMNKFPVADAIELKFKLYQTKDKSNYMLGF